MNSSCAEDDTAFVVLGYHDASSDLYVLEAEKESKLDITATAEHIRAYMGRFEFDRLIVDGANKMAVEEMKRRHSLPLHPADKTGKADFIALMNGELICGKIKLHKTQTQKLQDEYSGLIWNPRSTKQEEHPGCDNHLADACLYAWRYNYSFANEQEERPPKPGTPEFAKAQEDRMLDSRLRQVREQREADEELVTWGY